MSQILVVEDNEDLAYGLRNNLEIEGYDVGTAATGSEALRIIRDEPPDLVIMDLMLPEQDGFEVLETVRGDGMHMPVLILTAKGEEVDKVRGLRMGADDYVTKPFGLMELLARVEALLRRGSDDTHAARPEPAYAFGSIEIYPDSRLVMRKGEPVDLAPKEFDLLMGLIRKQGTVISRLDLMRDIWGHTSAIVSRTVDTHISELRRKLEEDPHSPRHIITVRKAGYRLDGSSTLDLFRQARKQPWL